MLLIALSLDEVNHTCYIMISGIQSKQFKKTNNPTYKSLDLLKSNKKNLESANQVQYFFGIIS